MTIELSLKTCIQTVDNIEGESYSFQTLNEMGAECEAETIPHTLLYTKYKVKWGLTTVVALHYTVKSVVANFFATTIV